MIGVMNLAWASGAFIVAIVLAGGATLIALVDLWNEKGSLRQVVEGFLAFSAIGVLAGLAARGLILQRFPMSGLYEFSLAFMLLVVVAYFILSRRITGKMFRLIVSVTLFSGIGVTMMIPHSDDPLMPALQSVWLTVHVATSIVAYGAFGIGAILGAMYLIEAHKKQEEKMVLYDALSQRAIIVGFIFQTLLLITGSIWAEEAWGNWWSWDPKETWALITWFIYAAYLHGYKSRGWQGKTAAIFSIVGIGIVFFTLFGVTFLLPGMHSYV